MRPPTCQRRFGGRRVVREEDIGAARDRSVETRRRVAANGLDGIAGEPLDDAARAPHVLD